MLKRNNAYCFLMQSMDSFKLQLLSGGNVLNVDEHDLNYFYDNLINYSNSIKEYLSSYTNFQKNISREIKTIGGSGRIHGCIIDIDCYNHLYINPIDASITPYFAFSMTNKYVYQNLKSLLKYKCPSLYLKYIEIKNDNKNSPQIINRDMIDDEKSTFVADTEIYRISKIIKELQYTTEYNIVRKWNDDIASSSSKENGKIIINGLLDSNPKK